MRGRSAATAAAEGERCGTGRAAGRHGQPGPRRRRLVSRRRRVPQQEAPGEPGHRWRPDQEKEGDGAWRFADSKERGEQKRQQGAGGEAVNENKFLNTDSSTGSVETTAKPLPFKDPNFIHSGIGGAAAGKKNRTWKNLKQILASERALPWQLNDPSYFNIDAPPSFKPAKKYSDISGLPANYTDPQSKLRFSTIEEFAYIRMLPSDVVTGYLALRKATSIVS
uniref:INO80 complex subunit C n=1 Tax=Corvus moneduloides TaxID=1196302 RepID=A0A8C3D5D1_CORMO